MKISYNRHRERKTALYSRKPKENVVEQLDTGIEMFGQMIVKD
jgi:hypothetical protein